MKRRVVMLALGLNAAACGTSSDTTVDGPVHVDAGALPTRNGAEVTVDATSGSASYRWSAEAGGLIRCRQATQHFEIRLAATHVNHGEDDVHVDFDICGFHGTGVYAGLDPLQTPCEGGASFFDVFWHLTRAPACT
jgi:hypothetical protein